MNEHFSVVDDHEQIPELTVSEQDLEQAHIKTFGHPDKSKPVSPLTFLDSDWSRTFERFFQERLVYVRSVNVLLLRFAYLYEVDLDRLKTERDLLGWVLHLVDKPWMGPERTKVFAETVAGIKHFNVSLRP
jgi:hypothetical protein